MLGWLCMTLIIQVNFRYRRYSERYWWFCLIDFHNFLTIYVLEVKQFIVGIPTKLPCLGDLRNSRLTSGTGGTRRYWWLCLIDFHNFFTIYAFGVKESIAGIPNKLKLPCLDDLKNQGQLPVHEVPRGTDDWLCLIAFHNFFTIHAFEVMEFIAVIPNGLSCLDDFENLS